jgi:hypothetical protein
MARTEECRNAFTILTAEPIGKIILGRPMRRWEDKIRTYFKYVLIRRTG